MYFYSKPNEIVLDMGASTDAKIEYRSVIRFLSLNGSQQAEIKEHIAILFFDSSTITIVKRLAQ